MYREVAPAKRLVFTWEWENPEYSVGDTVVAVDFDDAGDGTTDVVITHTRFGNEARAANHERGWAQLLRLIEQYVAEK